jgi:hypothetical protein
MLCHLSLGHGVVYEFISVLYAPATEEAIHDQLRATLIVASIKNTP